MIYAIREKETGLIKIGMCRDAALTRRSRLPAIRAKRARLLGRRCTLELVVWSPWPPSAEMDVHRYLWRDWVGDEWFTPSARTLIVVEWLKRTGSGYMDFAKAFRQERPQLPGQWHWMNRDKVIENHAAKELQAI
jgi:hypothetical protein